MPTNEDDLVSLVRQGGHAPMLERPPMPWELHYLWRWFGELSAARGSSFGPAAITFTEIKAWAELTWRELTPPEVALLRRLDSAFLKVRG